ncbi:MAG: ADP-dependent glucokinase/phosphofructokinase [Candidatus Micrarchaeia archaeon]|jgi:ADP-dependent phosphofructokinase/glucokinase
MQFPKKAIFAFNANIDHLIFATDEDAETIDRSFPEIASAMSESFGTGVQREMQIGSKECGFLLSSFKSKAKKIVGGQAGNAAEQASALGTDCLLHTNFANEELMKLFSHPKKIFAATEKGFAPADGFPSQSPSAHHFVFESAEAQTRFICSFDPFPLHPEAAFCEKINAELESVHHAFVGGMHLVKSADRVAKFAREIERWKEISPNLSVFVEMGESQNSDVLDAVRKEIFPLADIMGLNEVEIAQLGCTPEELAGEVGEMLFHTAESSTIYPEGKGDASALEFARKAAAFRAKNGRCGSEQEISGCDSAFVEKPAWRVGLGDALSCAYFMAMQ